MGNMPLESTNRAKKPKLDRDRGKKANADHGSVARLAQTTAAAASRCRHELATAHTLRGGEYTPWSKFARLWHVATVIF